MTIKRLSNWTIWSIYWLTLWKTSNPIYFCAAKRQGLYSYTRSTWCKPASSNSIRRFIRWWSGSKYSMSLRRENTAHGASSMRLPRTFTPPQQRVEGQVSRRSSLGHLQYSADKKPPYIRRNSFSCANDELSPTKLDFQSLKKRPSLLGGKLKSGSSRDTEGGGRNEKHSIVMLGAGGVGKTGIRDTVCIKFRLLSYATWWLVQSVHCLLFAFLPQPHKKRIPFYATFETNQQINFRLYHAARDCFEN